MSMHCWYDDDDSGSVRVRVSNYPFERRRSGRPRTTLWRGVAIYAVLAGFCFLVVVGAIAVWGWL